MNDQIERIDPKKIRAKIAGVGTGIKLANFKPSINVLRKVTQKPMTPNWVFGKAFTMYPLNYFCYPMLTPC